MGYRHLKINVPDENYDNSKNSNTKIAFLNIFMYFDIKDNAVIEYSKFDNFAKYFPSYVSVIKKKKLEFDESKIRYKLERELHSELRFKKINKYSDTNIIEKYIIDIISKHGNDNDKIVNNIANTFNISTITSQKIYNVTINKYHDKFAKKMAQKKKDLSQLDIDQVVNDLSIHPGLDIKIHVGNVNKIAIVGVTETELDQVQLFMEKLLKLYIYDMSHENEILHYLERHIKPAVINSAEEINKIAIEADQIISNNSTINSEKKYLEYDIKNQNSELMELNNELNIINSDVETLRKEWDDINKSDGS